MSKFYGMIQGNRGAATRGGSANSGFRASCQSFDGSVISRMNYDSNDVLKVSLEIAKGSSAYGDTVFSGTLDELKEALELHRQVKAGSVKIVKKATGKF